MDCGTTSSNQEFLAKSARLLPEEEPTKTTKLLGLLPIKESSTGDLRAKTTSESLFQGEFGEKRKANEPYWNSNRSYQ